MGLDAVELVLEIEEAFSIKIPDEEAEKLLTVGEVFDYILANTAVAKEPAVCLTAATFYAIRKSAKKLGITGRLHPRDSIWAILPSSERVSFWSQLQQATKLKLPSLRRPKWLVAVSTVVVIISSIVFGIQLYGITHSPGLSMAIAWVSGVLLGLLVRGLTCPFAICPPSHCRTLREFAEVTMQLNFQTIRARYHEATKSDLWVTLRSIIVNQLDVSPREVQPAARFVQDLGLN
jgi:acyl carrier protein